MKKYERYSKEEILLVLPECKSVADVARKLGRSPVGGNTMQIVAFCKKNNIDISGLKRQGWRKGIAGKKSKPEDILVLRTSSHCRIAGYRLRRALIEIGTKYQCKVCRNTGDWNNKKLTLEVDHSNGQYWDNRPENLQFLCPNCHSQKV